MVDVENRMPVCFTDPHRVEQILVNLLGNAIRHTPEGTKVRIGVTSADSVAQISIQDEGPGIDAEDVDQIFDIYMTKGGGKEGWGGSGLGLPLSRRLARLLGGELRAVPRAGGGGHFILGLPLAEV